MAKKATTVEVDPLEELLVDEGNEPIEGEFGDGTRDFPFEDDAIEIDPELEPTSANEYDELHETDQAIADLDDDDEPEVTIPETFVVSYAPTHSSFDPEALYALLDRDFVVFAPEAMDRRQRSFEVLASDTLVLVAGWTSNVNCNLDLLLARTHGMPVLEFQGGELKRSLATPQLIQIQNNMNRQAFPLNADQ